MEKDSTRLNSIRFTQKSEMRVSANTVKMMSFVENLFNNQNFFASKFKVSL